MQISKALRIYFFKVILPGFVLAIAVGFGFGWAAYYILKHLGTLATEYQYGLILPSFIALGVVLWAVYIANGLYVLIKNRKSIEEDSTNL